MCYCMIPSCYFFYRSPQSKPTKRKIEDSLILPPLQNSPAVPNSLKQKFPKNDNCCANSSRKSSEERTSNTPCIFEASCPPTAMVWPGESHQSQAIGESRNRTSWNKFLEGAQNSDSYKQIHANQKKLKEIEVNLVPLLELKSLHNNYCSLQSLNLKNKATYIGTLKQCSSSLVGKSIFQTTSESIVSIIMHAIASNPGSMSQSLGSRARAVSERAQPVQAYLVPV